MQSQIRLALLGAAALAASTSTTVGAQFPGDSPGAKLVNKLLGDHPRSAPVSTFAVAGVTLGMSPEEARAALTKAGFTPRAEDPTQDAWSAVVSQRAADRIGGKVERTKVPMFTMAEGPQGEHIEVWYSATEAGAKASSVKYQMPTNRMERVAFASSATAKYGKPTFEDRTRALYCTKGEPTCTSWQNKDLPYLSVESSFANHEIELRQGQRYGAEMKARMAAAVEAAAPKNAKASF
jgi:hypothetical protein